VGVVRSADAGHVVVSAWLSFFRWRLYCMEEGTPRASAKPQKLWIYPVTVVVVTIIAFPIAAGFYTPSGPRARVLLPGVLIAVGTALTSCILFLCCPSRPLRPKLLTLFFAVPSLLFAVNCVMEHIALNP
jgi:lipopolysaccharide export LptBFGC system permease protein LptF